MAAALDALGEDRAAVLDPFTSQLLADGHVGTVSLGAVAHLASGSRT